MKSQINKGEVADTVQIIIILLLVPLSVWISCTCMKSQIDKGEVADTVQIIIIIMVIIIIK